MYVGISAVQWVPAARLSKLLSEGWPSSHASQAQDRAYAGVSFMRRKGEVMHRVCPRSCCVHEQLLQLHLFQPSKSKK